MYTVIHNKWTMDFRYLFLLITVLDYTYLYKHFFVGFVWFVGSHSIGVTHCNNVLSRFDNENATNANMDPRFQTFLRVVCPEFSPTSKTAEATFVPNDQTSLIFDTAYYDDSIAGRGNLRIDSEIGVDPRTRPFVEAFAADQDRFFGSFSSAFVKLSSYKVLTGNNGVVRSVCDKVDWCIFTTIKYVTLR